MGNGEGTDFEARLTEFCHFLCEFKQLSSPLWASLMTRTLTLHAVVKARDNICKVVSDTMVSARDSDGDSETCSLLVPVSLQAPTLCAWPCDSHGVYHSSLLG